MKLLFVVINVFLNFHNDFKVENDRFRNVYLYDDMLEILRKLYVRKGFENFWKVKTFKRKIFFWKT